MAEALGNTVHHWRAKLAASVDALTDTHATVRAAASWCSIAYGYEVYANGEASVGGQSSGAVGFDALSGWGESAEIGVAEKSATFERRGDDYQVECRARVQLTGWPEANGTSEAVAHVTVPARVLQRPGVPALSASSSSAKAGEKVSFTFARAASQGNAPFSRFELYENGVRVYSGTGAGCERTPSEAQGASVAYELREVHDWYGTEVYTSAAVRVSVVRESAPAAPALVSPASGATVACGPVPLAWRHSPLDGSAQTAAQVRTGPSASGPWTVADVSGAAQSLSARFDDAGDAYWQVRTKGAHPDWSPWSSAGYFKVREAPGLTLSVPATLAAFPLSVSWKFYDPYGVQASATVSVKRDGTVIASKSAGTASQAWFSASELAVADGDALTVELSATSTTGLSSRATASSTVKFTPPSSPVVIAMVDDAALAVAIVVGPGAGDAPGTLVDVRRGEKLVASGLSGTSEVRDPVPPLDVPIVYTATARNAAGAQAEAEARVAVPSRGRCAINFGDGLESAAVAAFNLSWDEEHGVESESFDAAAYELPVEVYGTHRTRTGKLDATVEKRASAHASTADWRDAAAWGGGYALRLPFAGEALWVAADVSVSEDGGPVNGVSVNWEVRAHDGVL